MDSPPKPSGQIYTLSIFFCIVEGWNPCASHQHSIYSFKPLPSLCLHARWASSSEARHVFRWCSLFVPDCCCHAKERHRRILLGWYAGTLHCALCVCVWGGGGGEPKYCMYSVIQEIVHFGLYYILLGNTIDCNSMCIQGLYQAKLPLWF